MANLEQAQNLKFKIENLGGKLIAVSKKFSAEEVVSVNKVGIKDFGENYVSEAVEKIESLKSLDINWHFIGRVQTGNLNKIVNRFYMIHSIHKLEHIKKINERTLVKQKILLQLQHREDERGFGLSKDELVKILKVSSEYENIDFSGIMFMPPVEFDKEQLASAFKWVEDVFKSGKSSLSSEGSSWDTLSMGMSADYDLALNAGSTHVRIGTAIFGQRDK